VPLSFNKQLFEFLTAHLLKASKRKSWAAGSLALLNSSTIDRLTLAKCRLYRFKKFVPEVAKNQLLDLVWQHTGLSSFSFCVIVGRNL
jgi:hypothetical protein